MSPEKQSEKQLPPFVRIGTLRDMTAIAKRLATAKKAVQFVVDIEKEFEARKDTMSIAELKLAMDETKRFANIVANSAKSAIEILRTVKPKVRAYQREALNAVG